MEKHENLKKKIQYQFKTNICFYCSAGVFEFSTNVIISAYQISEHKKEEVSPCQWT